MPNKLIDIVGVSKSYGDNLVLDDLNLYIRENEFLTLLGPSGCGKTTVSYTHLTLPVSYTHLTLPTILRE